MSFHESPAFPFRSLSEQELKNYFINDAWVDEVGQHSLNFTDAEPSQWLSRGEQEHEARLGIHDIFTNLDSQYESLTSKRSKRRLAEKCLWTPIRYVTRWGLIM